MHIHHVSNYFYPATAWGGPVVALHALCDELAGHKGLTLSVLTTDALGPHRRDRVQPKANPWRFEAGYDVTFSRVTLRRFFSLELIRRAVGQVRRADLVHITGAFTLNLLWTMAVARGAGKSMVWSPRGAVLALDTFPAASKPVAKRVYLALVRAMLDPARCVLHCTSMAEQETMARHFPRFRTQVIANGVAPPDPPMPRRRAPREPFRLLFLSRLDPKKGIEALLEALPLVQRKVTLDVCGAGAPEYERRLRAIVRDSGLDEVVQFRGHVDGAAREAAFAAADLFVLPSHSENFGNVIAEALVRGLPVVTTTNTPWHELAARGCGRCIGRAPELIVAAIDELCGQDLAAMGAAGRDWMRAEFSWAARADAFAALYRRVTG